jgi:hypothetical protein
MARSAHRGRGISGIKQLEQMPGSPESRDPGRPHQVRRRSGARQAAAAGSTRCCERERWRLRRRQNPSLRVGCAAAPLLRYTTRRQQIPAARCSHRAWLAPAAAEPCCARPPLRRLAERRRLPGAGVRALLRHHARAQGLRAAAVHVGGWRRRAAGQVPGSCPAPGLYCNWALPALQLCSGRWALDQAAAPAPRTLQPRTAYPAAPPQRRKERHRGGGAPTAMARRGRAEEAICPRQYDPRGPRDISQKSPDGAPSHTPRATAAPLGSRPRLHVSRATRTDKGLGFLIKKTAAPSAPSGEALSSIAG